MTTPLPPDVKTLFRAPFRTDRQELEDAGSHHPCGRALFVNDADGHMASSWFTRRRVEPRGHGYHAYLPSGIQRHDAWCAWFTANVPERATLEDVARILNEAWAAP